MQPLAFTRGTTANAGGLARPSLLPGNAKFRDVHNTITISIPENSELKKFGGGLSNRPGR